MGIINDAKSIFIIMLGLVALGLVLNSPNSDKLAQTGFGGTNTILKTLQLR